MGPLLLLDLFVTIVAPDAADFVDDRGNLNPAELLFIASSQKLLVHSFLVKCAEVALLLATVRVPS